MVSKDRHDGTGQKIKIVTTGRDGIYIFDRWDGTVHTVFHEGTGQCYNFFHDGEGRYFFLFDGTSGTHIFSLLHTRRAQ